MNILIYNVNNYKLVKILNEIKLHINKINFFGYNNIIDYYLNINFTKIDDDIDDITNIIEKYNIKIILTNTSFEENKIEKFIGKCKFILCNKSNKIINNEILDFYNILNNECKDFTNECKDFTNKNLINEIALKDNSSKKIFMCHKTLNKMENSSKYWKNLNDDYNIIMYDDNKCIDFFKNECPEIHIDIFNYLKDGPIKADFWRICILYKYGGIYVDADIIPFIPLDNFVLENVDLVTCYIKNIENNMIHSGNNNFNPHFIKCKPNDIYIKNCIDIYIKKYNNKDVYHYWDWSIVQVFQKVFNFVKQYEPIYEYNNYKIQLLDNIYGKYNNVYRDEHSIFDGKIIFKNR